MSHVQDKFTRCWKLKFQPVFEVVCVILKTACSFRELWTNCFTISQS